MVTRESGVDLWLGPGAIEALLRTAVTAGTLPGTLFVPPANDRLTLDEFRVVGRAEGERVILEAKASLLSEHGQRQRFLEGTVALQIRVTGTLSGLRLCEVQLTSASRTLLNSWGVEVRSAYFGDRLDGELAACWEVDIAGRLWSEGDEAFALVDGPGWQVGERASATPPHRDAVVLGLSAEAVKRLVVSLDGAAVSRSTSIQKARATLAKAGISITAVIERGEDQWTAKIRIPVEGGAWGTAVVTDAGGASSQLLRRVVETVAAGLGALGVRASGQRPGDGAAGTVAVGVRSADVLHLQRMDVVARIDRVECSKAGALIEARWATRRTREPKMVHLVDAVRRVEPGRPIELSGLIYRNLAGQAVELSLGQARSARASNALARVVLEPVSLRLGQGGEPWVAFETGVEFSPVEVASLVQLGLVDAPALLPSGAASIHRDVLAQLPVLAIAPLPSR